MIETYICIALLAIATLLLLVALVNACTPVYLPKKSSLANTPLVSILIPARNEEKNLSVLLGDIASLSYSDYELIVYDDDSDDDTASVVSRHAMSDSRIRLVSGSSLPAGWLGKNYACWRLSQEAKGKYLLFLDADVRVKGSLIEKSLYYMQKHNVKLLSIFPKQILDNRGAWLTVPIMNVILLSLLPLILIRLSSWKSFSAANGQFMMFETHTYNEQQPHMTSKNVKAEDIAICRYYKKRKIKLATLLGDAQICCRMYDGYDEAVEGFSKNIFAFFGNSPVLAIVFAAYTSFASFCVWYLAGFGGFLAFMLLVILKRMLIARTSRQPVWKSLVYMLAQQVVLWRIIGAAFVRKHKNSLSWKGRNIS